jgi:hypothetical protein
MCVCNGKVVIPPVDINGSPGSILKAWVNPRLKRTASWRAPLWLYACLSDRSPDKAYDPKDAWSPLDQDKTNAVLAKFVRDFWIDLEALFTDKMLNVRVSLAQQGIGDNHVSSHVEHGSSPPLAQPANPSAAASETAEPRQELISFTRGKNATRRAIPFSDPCVLVHTFDKLWRLLAQVRIAVINSTGKISAEKLEEEFRPTYLGKAASIEDYREFADVFADHKTRAKNIAYVFLHKKLGRSVGSLKSSICRTRKQIRINHR